MEGLRLSRSIVGSGEGDAVRRVIEENGYLGMGSEVQAFENELAAYLGVAQGDVTCVNSGTAALHLAVLACLPEGGEVLVPTLTYVASFQAVRMAGAIPIACDVLPESGLIDLADAKKRVTPRTRAIMPVHYASNPGDLEAVYAFAREHTLRVIEDAAHAFGNTYKGRKIGAAGDVVCFSFDGIKNITCGEGGALVSRDPAVTALARDARLLSVENDTEKRYAGARSWDFDVTRIGFRYHMSNIMAAIGRAQLKRLDGEFAPARRALSRQYRQRLKHHPDIAFFEADLEEMVPHIQPVRVLNAKREKLAEHLKKNGIPTGMHYKPNHLLTFFAQSGPPLPVAEQLAREIITLPLHPGLSENDVTLICDEIERGLQP